MVVVRVLQFHRFFQHIEQGSDNPLDEVEISQRGLQITVAKMQPVTFANVSTDQLGGAKHPDLTDFLAGWHGDSDGSQYFACEDVGVRLFSQLTPLFPDVVKRGVPAAVR